MNIRPGKEVIRQMATWIVHLRIADEYIKRGLIPCPKEFSLGSVAPDCGYGEKDSFGDFSPPPDITHWAPGGVKLYCEYWKFASVYLQNKQPDTDHFFYLGYYIHLLTDVIWSRMVYNPTVEKYKEEFKRDPEFIKTIKIDWYDLDHKFLRDHPSFVPYQYIKNSGDVHDYLPYYEPGQLTAQIKYIYDYYSNSEQRVLDRDYTYLTEKNISNFIKCAAELIDLDLIKKGLLDIPEKTAYVNAVMPAARLRA